MISSLIAIAVMAVIVAAAYAVLSGSIGSPERLRLVRRARGRETPRRREPQRSPLAAPRRGVLPDMQELSWALDTHRWVADKSAPIASELSAHANHDACPWCALCNGDSEEIARVALMVVASALDRSLTDAQLPIVNVDAAVGDYRRQLAGEVQS